MRRLDPLNAGRQASSASTLSSPASTSAGSVTAGICQSQSIEACRDQTTSAAVAPAASCRCAPSARRAATAIAAGHQREREQPDEAELGGDLDLERVRVAHRLADRALLQPDHAEAARPGAVSGASRKAPRATRQYS